MWVNFARQKRRILRGLVFAAFIGLTGASAPAAHAANCPGTSSPYFICPTVSSGGNLGWDVLSLTASPNGLPDTLVAANDVINVTLSYRPANSAGGTVYSWISLDANNSQMQQDAFGNPVFAGSSFTGSDPPTSSAGAQIKCPSNWYWGDWVSGGPVPGSSHYYNHNAEEVLGHTPGSFYDYLAYGGRTDGLGYSTCGQEGQTMYWQHNGVTAGTNYQFNLQLRVNPNTLNNNVFCFRGYVGVSAPAPALRFSNVYARSRDRHCFHVDPVTVSGNVHTDRTSGSGRPIANTSTVISVWRAGGSTNPVSTDASGNYSFQTTRGQLYNITARSPINYQGTNYTLSNPTTPYISTCPANCANRDFVYTPDVKYPVIRKTANVANGAAVSPGQAISYTITSQTDSDYSPASDVFEDWLPLNLDYDPTSLRASIIVDPSSANKPTNYYIDLGSSIPCDGLSHTLFYGITSVIGAPSVRCTYTPGSAGTPARVSLSASRMPPYALATLRFGGTVKPASQVGVYPGNPNRYPGNPSPTNADFRYCNNTGAADFTNQASIMANCQDYTEGLQGLMNAAVQAINGDVFTLSHITPMLYNPIPGRVSTVTKDYTNKDGAGNFIYNPTDPILNNGIFSIQVNHDPSSGPVYYRVNDQAGPSTLDPAMAYSAGSCNVVAGVTLGSGGNNCSSGGAQGPILWAGGSPSGLIDNRTATSDSPLYNFRVTWPIGGVLGQVHCNTPQIVGIDYSVWPHANFSKTPLAPTCVTYAYSTSPGISANNGNIYAGGVPTPGSSCFGGTGNVNLSNSTSQFLVAASGATISGVASPSSSRSYLIRCRDDMSTAAQQLVSGGVISSPVSSDAGFDGKVKQGPSGVVIPAGGLNVNSRWTLYVPGDVYIRGNIVRTGANAMMGIIATGNVYISPGVTQVDALVVSSAGKIYTCGNGPGAVFQSPGVDVNTCSNTLTVNGLFMAKDIKFDRTYPYCAPNCSLLGARERFSLPASLYTLVPPAFTTPSSQPGAVQFKGEAAPRY